MKKLHPSWFLQENGFLKILVLERGNVVTFLMEHEHLSYPEALRWLANKYQIEIQEEAPNEEQLEEKNKRDYI